MSALKSANQLYATEPDALSLKTLRLVGKYTERHTFRGFGWKDGEWPPLCTSAYYGFYSSPLSHDDGCPQGEDQDEQRHASHGPGAKS